MQRAHLSLLLWVGSLVLLRVSFAAEGETTPAVMPLAPIQLRTINGKRQEIDLPTVLKLAQERNLAVGQAQERANEQRANLASARAELLPNLKFDTGIGRTLGNISNIAQIPNARATLFLNPARSIFTAKAVDKLAQATEADLQSVMQGTLLTAIVQYYDLLRAQGQIRIAEQAVEAAQRLVTTTKALHEQGLAIRADVLRAQTELADKQQRLLEVQRDYRVASINLATTLNLDPTVTLFPTDREIRQTTGEIGKLGNEEIGKLVERALKKRPETASAAQTLSAAQQQRKATVLGQIIPGFGVERWFGGFTGDRSTFYFVEWNILDQLGLLLGTRRRAEKARVKQAQLRQEQVSDRIEAEVLAARERVLTAEEQIHTAQQAVAQAEETLRVSEERLREVVGVLKDSSINVLEVLQAQDALNRARRNFVNALVDYNQAEAGLLYALGEISTRNMVNERKKEVASHEPNPPRR